MHGNLVALHNDFAKSTKPGKHDLQNYVDYEAHAVACCEVYLRQEGVEPQNQLNVAIEQHLDLMNYSFSVDSAQSKSHKQHARRQQLVLNMAWTAGACSAKTPLCRQTVTQ